MNCIFCKIIDGSISSYKVWENDKFLVFLDIKPLNKGHILLIPKKHVDEIYEIEDEEYIELFENAKKLAGPLKIATNAKRIGYVVEGFEVNHSHLHLIPINKGHDLNPDRAKFAAEDELSEMQEMLADIFKSIK